MYKLCKTEQSTARQRAVEKGLLELMAKQRYEDITVSSLCEKLDIPRKTFYRYFSSKDGALYALLDHTMLEFTYSTLSSAHDTVYEELSQFFYFWYSQKPLLDVLQRSGLSGILVERANSLAIQERMMPRNIMTLNADLQSIALSFAVCGIMSMVIQWHHTGFRQTPQEMSHLASTLLTRPLLSRPQYN